MQPSSPHMPPMRCDTQSEAALLEVRDLLRSMSGALSQRLEDLERSASDIRREVHALKNKLAPQGEPREAPVTKEREKPSRLKSGAPEQYTVDLLAIRNNKDTRTTCMIKNVPNKLNRDKMLRLIEQQCPNPNYNFFYLPIDPRNNCNVGYAFINFAQPRDIIPFYQTFHNCDWTEYNSSKICEIVYARLQGKDTLMDHFADTSVVNNPAGPVFGPPGEAPSMIRRVTSGGGAKLPQRSVPRMPPTRHKSCSAAISRPTPVPEEPTNAAGYSLTSADLASLLHAFANCGPTPSSFDCADTPADSTISEHMPAAPAPFAFAEQLEKGFEVWQ